MSALRSVCGSRAVLVFVVLAFTLLAGAVSPGAAGQTPFEQAWASGRPITVTGLVTAIYADDFANHRAELVYLIRDERTGKSLQLRFEHEAPRGLGSGTRLTVRGRSVGSEILIAADQTDPSANGGTSTLQAISQPAPTLSGDQSTLVIVANFTDSAVACTAADIDNTMFSDPAGLSVNNLYTTTSRGLVSFSGRVTGPFSINAASTDPCDITSWAQAAEAAATASGVNIASYAHKMYVMPPNSCPAAGFGTIGGTPSAAWVFTCNLKGVFAHEIGHNLGMDHASTPTSEYNDTTDPMSFGSTPLRGLNGPHKQELRWLTPGAAQLVNGSGSFDIAALAQDPATTVAPQVVMIAKPDTSEYYYLSYREPLDFDSFIDGSYYNRLSIHRYKGDGSASRTYLLAGLADGESFVDQVNGITITQTGHDAAHATARVELGPNAICTPAPPVLTLSPVAQGGTAGTSLTYIVTVTNRDSSACAGTAFAMTVGGPAGWTATPSPTTLTLAAGATGQAMLTVTSPVNAIGGTYDLAANISDSISSIHTATGSMSYSVIAPCVVSAPAIAASPASQSGLAGSSRAYTVAITNRDGAACAASTFAIQASVPANWSGIPYPATVTLTPGQATSLSVSVSSPVTAVPGSYQIVASVSDTGKPGHGGSAIMAYNVVAPADTTPPATPGGLTATASQKLKQITLSWTASTDNVGVAGYQIWKNGLRVATSAVTSWIDSTYVSGTYYVVAYDAAGNLSTPSGSVTLKLSTSGKK